MGRNIGSIWGARAALAMGAWLAVGAVAWAEGGYEGVVPGSSTIPDRIAAQPGQAALVTWPGFQMLPTGGSRVFIQTSVEVKPELKREGREYTLVLPKVALPPGNTRRPLDTHFFDTPVTSVRTKAMAGGVAVVVALRADVAPVLRTEMAATGYFFTYLDFPAGNYR